MSLESTLRLGPLNLPVRYLLFIAAAAAGYLVMSLVLLKKRDLRRSGGNRVLNALGLFIVVWKLEPLGVALATGIARGRVDLQGVVLQLFVPGGLLAAAIGAGAAVVYLLVSIFRDDGRRGLHSAAVAAAIVPAVVFYLAGAALLRPNQAQLARAATASGAAHLPVGTAVGDRAPLFDAASIEGAHYSLGEAHGKAIVLNFWATWCPPCRAELPDLVRFAAAHRAGGAVVWGVNMTTSEPSIAAVRAFSHRYGVDFPVLLDPAGKIARAYEVTALPTTYIISPQGVILAKQVGAMSPSWLSAQVRSAVR